MSYASFLEHTPETPYHIALHKRTAHPRAEDEVMLFPPLSSLLAFFLLPRLVVFQGDNRKHGVSCKQLT